MEINEVLTRMGLVSQAMSASSSFRFPDGAEFRIEIPSIEGPDVFEALLSAADSEGVVVNRVSQGSGAGLLTKTDLSRMAALGNKAGVEVSLFTGPRAGFDIGALSRAPSGSAQYAQLRGLRQIQFAIDDVLRAVEAGIRSFLIGDIGLLVVLQTMKEAGDIPPSVLWKISAYMGGSNPASLRLLEKHGAGTINVPADVTVQELGEMRASVEIPLDIYLETPDDMGRIIRIQEIADLVDVGAPLYTKYGLSNAQKAYPAGRHTLENAICAAEEKVRRAAIACEWLERTRPSSIQSEPHAAGLAIPEVS